MIDARKIKINDEAARVMQAQLRELLSFLPSKDQAFARSLASSHGLTENQAFYARTLIKKGEKWRVSGVKGGARVEQDIFADAEASGGVDDFLAEAKQVPPGRPPSVPTSDATREIVEIGADDLHDALAKVVEPALAAIAKQVDERAEARQQAFNRLAAGEIAKQVLARALEELEKRKPREVVVRVDQDDVSRTTAGEHVHPKFETLCRAATTRVNGFPPGIFLAGEASSGKTTGTSMLAKVLGLKWHFNGAISFPHEMLGFIDASGRYHRTPFREAYEHGGVYTFDEVDRSDPVALLAVNPHLANGVATFPDGQVSRHRDCIIVATANTWGLGGDANYSGATKLDAAFLSRFPVKIAWDIDLTLEEKLVGAGPWLSRVRAARQRAREVGLKVMIDTRIAMTGAQLIAGGYSLNETAQMTYLANLKPEQRTQLGEANAEDGEGRR